VFIIEHCFASRGLHMFPVLLSIHKTTIVKLVDHLCMSVLMITLGYATFESLGSYVYFNLHIFRQEMGDCA